MPGENGTPIYRNQYVGREPGFKAPDPAMSGGFRAIILSQGSLEQSGVLKEQAGYNSQQLAFSGHWTDVRVAQSARIRYRGTLDRLVCAGVDNRTPELARSTCGISGEVVYLPSTRASGEGCRFTDEAASIMVKSSQEPSCAALKFLLLFLHTTSVLDKKPRINFLLSKL
jgi:hypothetical protein